MAPQPISNADTTSYTASTNFGAGSGNLPDVGSGESVVAVSLDDENFTPVDQSVTGSDFNDATDETGSYLDFKIIGNGNILERAAPGGTSSDTQALIDAINNNDGAAASLSQTLYYEVKAADGTIRTDSETFNLNDLAIGTAQNPPFTQQETVNRGATVSAAGISVQKALSTGQTSSDSTIETARLQVYGSGSLSATQGTSGDTVTISSDGSLLTITGTQAQVNADLQTLTFTAGNQTGTTYIDFGVSSGNEENPGFFVASFDVACYVRGTLILTASGEVPVEELAIGDLLVTAAGAHRPIRWLGRRAYAGRFANVNPEVLPIRFAAGSLGAGSPRRDLWVSPKHAMFLDGILIPAEQLVDGIAVTQATRVEAVEYFHVELDSHDVIVAEGALSETFVDDRSRAMFHNAREFAALYPDAVPVPAVYCAPRVEDGFALEAVRRRLADRAVDLGCHRSRAA